MSIMVSSSSSKEQSTPISPFENLNSFTSWAARFKLSSSNNLVFCSIFLVWSTQEFLFIGDRPRKLKTFEAAAWPPPIARKPRTDARLIAKALLFSVVENGRLHSRDGQLSFWHWNIQREPSPLLLPKFSTSWTLPWQKRQVTDSLIFSCSLSPATIAWPWIFCHVSVLSRSASGSSTVIFDRLALHVDEEIDGSHSALGCSFNSFSNIALGRSKNLYRSPLISEPNQS